MRRLGLLLILLLPFAWLQAQVTHGKIVDADDGKPITGASIYLSGTYKGTTSDANGDFELRTDEKNIAMVVSYVGYNSETITDYAGKNLKVLLKHKPNMLKEVTIGYDAMSREKEMKIFMREFIGDDHKCTIKNLEDISFTYHKKDDVLEAFADNPLVIENKDLGYTVTYFLDGFSYSNNLAGFGGDFYFKEDTAGLTPKEIKKILKARDKAYFGSRMHFIRSLWANDLNKQNFSINVNGDDITYKDLVIELNGEKYMKYVYKMTIIYNNYNGSYLQQPEPLKATFIARNGFYDHRIIWQGFMALQRVGDLLPFEFQPQKH